MIIQIIKIKLIFSKEEETICKYDDRQDKHHHEVLDVAEDFEDNVDQWRNFIQETHEIEYSNGEKEQDEHLENSLEHEQVLLLRCFFTVVISEQVNDIHYNLRCVHYDIEEIRLSIKFRKIFPAICSHSD